MDPQGAFDPTCGAIRIATFRVRPSDTYIHEELRGLARREWGRCRWIGRRLLDDPEGAEIAVISTWDDGRDMQRQAINGLEDLSRPLRAAVAGASVETYERRAIGIWTRRGVPCLLRVFRGALVEGDAAHFDEAAAAAYVGVFEANPSCIAIAAGIRHGGVALVTLWNSWDAVVSATGGDLRQVLPVRLPGWAVTGSAVHYELVAAENR